MLGDAPGRSRIPSAAPSTPLSVRFNGRRLMGLGSGEGFSRTRARNRSYYLGGNRFGGMSFLGWCRRLGRDTFGRFGSR
jgi:hypothetical protein